MRYNEAHPEHTGDAWNEYQCASCHVRIGRWSGMFLQGKEMERKGFEPSTAYDGQVHYRREVPKFDPGAGDFTQVTK